MEPPAVEMPQCSVSGADKLPAGVGSDAICAAIRAAAGERAPGSDFAVEVRVKSASSLAAAIKLTDGRMLPEQRMAVSDRQLNQGSIERFAAAIADQVAKVRD